jgi:hypothetical protein
MPRQRSPPSTSVFDLKAQDVPQASSAKKFESPKFFVGSGSPRHVSTISDNNPLDQSSSHPSNGNFSFQRCQRNSESDFGDFVI